MVAMLNPSVEASVCRKMIDHVQAQLHQVEQQLTHTPLDMNAYHAAFGRAAGLRVALKDLTIIYDQNFNV
jgi:hypothetical protein